MDYSVFDNDLAARFAEVRPDPQPTGEWEDYDKEVSQQIGAGPDQTTAGFAWNFANVYGLNLQSLVQSGDYAKARAYRDQLRESIEANRDNLLDLARNADNQTPMGQPGPGQITLELAKRAKDVLMYGFDNAEVTLPDGTKSTVGAVLADGSPVLAGQTQDLEQAGFGSNVAGLLMQGDDMQRQVMKTLTNPIMQPQGRSTRAGQVPNRLQIVNLANDVANNWDRLSETFGDGLVNFVDYVSSSHASSGNASATLRTLTELAEALNANGEYSGKDLAARVINGYNDMLAAAYRGDEAYDEQGRVHQAQISDNQRRTFDAVVLPAIQTALRQGVTPDFRDPRFRQAVKEVADTISFVSASGADLFTEARDKGFDLNGDFGRYIVSAISGAPAASGNIVETTRRLRQSLDQYVMGGRDTTPVPVQMSGQSKDYISSIEKSNGSKSSCPEADGMALSAKQYIMRSLLPFMAGGHRVDDAFNYVLSDDTRRERFLAGLADQLAPSFHGDGAGQLARLVAEQVVQAVLGGRGLSIEEAVANIAMDGKVASDMPAVSKAANAWYHGNVSNAVITAEYREQLKAHLREQGLTPSQILRVLSNISSLSSVAQAHGADPVAPYTSAMRTGRMKIPVYDDKGNLVDVQTVIRNFDKTPFEYRDPATGKVIKIEAGLYSQDIGSWALIQKSLAEQEEELKRIREQERRMKEYKDKADIRQQKAQENAQFRHDLAGDGGVDL